MWHCRLSMPISQDLSFPLWGFFSFSPWKVLSKEHQLPCRKAGASQGQTEPACGRERQNDVLWFQQDSLGPCCTVKKPPGHSQRAPTVPLQASHLGAVCVCTKSPPWRNSSLQKPAAHRHLARYRDVLKKKSPVQSLILLSLVRCLTSHLYQRRFHFRGQNLHLNATALVPETRSFSGN